MSIKCTPAEKAGLINNWHSNKTVKQRIHILIKKAAAQATAFWLQTTNRKLQHYRKMRLMMKFLTGC
jgi:hypothetical protein